MPNQSIILSVPEMHCASCPKLIKVTLSELDGVVDVSASLDTKTVTVEFDPSLTSPKLLIDAIEEVGYTAKPQI
jgi:copper chaperone CopZ